MPVINFLYSDLCELIGREVPRELVRERLPMLGADLKAMDDSSDEVSFEFFPDRPDLYSVEGVARALRAFFDYEPGLRSYAVGDSDVDLFAEPSVKDVRPFIWSALIEDNEITDSLIRSMMDLQEKLHLTLGRNRRKVAIGIHDFRTVKPPFTYKAVRPDEVSFVPLQGTKRMTLDEILREHEKGRAYAFVLEGKERYPIIVDREGEVLSFPPIINGITTAVTEETRDIFVDCTGTDIHAVTAAVNILATALAERGGKIKTVRIHQDGKTLLAPDLRPMRMSLDIRFANEWLGTRLTEEEMAACMRRMGYGAIPHNGQLELLVPRYRADIIHEVDLVEDVAIGYGYEKFGESLPRVMTFGSEDPLVSFGSVVKDLMTGLGYFEVVTLALSNPEEQYRAMNLEPDPRALRVMNPVSEELVLVRTSLLPGLMAILRKNKHRELPQKLFEVGEVVLDGRNRTLLAGVSAHAKAGFTEVKSVVQSVLSGLGMKPDVDPTDHPSFICGRCALALADGEHVGVLGEISPATIEAFGLKHPVVAFELDLEKLYRLKKGIRPSS